MFTGIIETTGIVQLINPAADSIQLTLEIPFPARELALGDSIAVNGCCLTIARIAPWRRSPPSSKITFDLLQETWNRTSFQFLRRSAKVNLERALPADGRLAGHFVTGHIDGLGQITRWEKQGSDWLLEIAPPAEVYDLLIPKGSIAIDGISLTVASVLPQRFQAWIIPHTFEITVLHQKNKGDWVNLESDILGKYVRRFTQVQRQTSPIETASIAGANATMPPPAEPATLESNSSRARPSKRKRR